VDPQISRAVPVNAQALQQLLAAETAVVVESQEDFEQYVSTSPFVIYQRFRPMQEIKSSVKKPEEAEVPEEKKALLIKDIEESAGKFERNNPEFKARTLLLLRSSITEDDTPEELLNKVLRLYPDYSLADEALDFLIETTQGRVNETAKLAKEQIGRTFEREIKAGRNMGALSREFSKEWLTSLRDLYRDITGNPREPLQLFEELTQKFPYSKMNAAIAFLLHSLGADLKAKGSSIPRGELKRLIDETRSLQGILGVFRFFQSRMRLIEQQFSFYSLLYPPQLGFELLSKLFIKLLIERYMNAEKLLQFSQFLGISEEVAAQIIIFTQYRDALKQIAPRYYRNPQHRDELIKAILDALEQLEDELEKEEEEREKEEKEKEKQ